MKRLTGNGIATGLAYYERLRDIENILGDEYDLDLLQKQIQAYREGRYIILKEPEQAGVSRLRELAQADREERCVVLPVKSGTTVYYLGAGMCKWRELDKCDEYCDGWQYEDCYEGERAVREKKFSISDLPYIGKTVFLTRADAEAALQGEQEEKR